MLPGTMPVMAGVRIVGVPSLSAASSVADETQYLNAGSSAEISVTAAGEILGATVAEGSFVLGDWIAPKSGMEEFSVRWTNTSGTLSSGTAGSWQALTSTRSFGASVAVGPGTKNVTGTLEIARTDNTAVILATKAGIDLHARSVSMAAP